MTPTGMTPQIPHINLLDLGATTVGRVTLLGDDNEPRIVDVRPINGAVYQAVRMLEQARSTGKDVDMMGFYAAAEECLIGVTTSEVLRLTPEQVGAVLAVAGGSAARVEALAEERAAAQSNGSGSTAGKARAGAAKRAPSGPLTLSRT